ncbi:MAG: C1 family peptidase [Saprospiraceae bacterium]|nr:C1 family peptidase [Saprospiraceae bacterium]
MPNDQELETAKNFRIKDFLTLFNSGDPPAIKIQRTKLSLAQNKPVILGIELINNFQNIRSGQEYWYPSIGDASLHGGHSLVVVGFDDGREAFEVMNSWGTDWGNGGFVWIKYRDLAKYAHYGYVFIPNDENSGFVDLVGSIAIGKPTYSDTGSLSFEKETVIRTGNYFELTSKVRKGDLLQPVLVETVENMYFYFFSLNSQNELKIHWPRDEKIDGHYGGTSESAIITLPKIQLAIPAAYGALQLSRSGVEYWCFLFSKSPIDNFNQSMDKIKASKEVDLYKRLEKSFGDKLLKPDKLKYSDEKMQLESALINSEIVPILLKLRIDS